MNEMRANTIDEVINRLDQIIADAHQSKSRVGYFACLYRHVTVTVKEKIDAGGYFEDGQRLERLDVAFANRYFEAVELYIRGETGAGWQGWQAALDATRSGKPIVLQHLFLAMNPHINIDLGAAAAQVCPGDSIHALQNDFNKMNDLLASLTHSVESELAKIYPVLHLLHRVSHGADKTVMNFGMKEARVGAWNLAQKLAYMNATDQETEIVKVDQAVAGLGHAIWKPIFPINLIFALFRWAQWSSVPRTIDVLLDPRFRRAMHEEIAEEREHETAFGVALKQT